MSFHYETQYGVIHSRKWPEEGLHRGPYDTEAEAQSFVDEWLLDGGKEGILTVVVRTLTVGDWLPNDFDKKFREWANRPLGVDTEQPTP